MKKSIFEPDPAGDVLLVLRRPNSQHLIWPQADGQQQTEKIESGGEIEEPTSECVSTNQHDECEEVHFRLSSKHLSLASPVFGAMFSGGWKESIAPVEQKTVEKKGKLDTEPLRYEVAATEWDTQTFLLLMNIMHGRHREVPLFVETETLAKFSVLVDYYKCHEIAEIFARIWVEHRSYRLPTSYGRESTMWLFISWVFPFPDEFKRMTKLAIQNSKGSFETMKLPLPASLIAALEQKRADSLHQILHVLETLHEDLVTGSKGCNFACSSLLLGSLIKAMYRYKIRLHEPSEYFSSRNLEQIIADVRQFETSRNLEQIIADVRQFETSAKPSGRSVCSKNHGSDCNLQEMLKPAIDNIWLNLNGLDLDDYRAK